MTHVDIISFVPITDVNFDFSFSGDETHISASVTSNSVSDEGPLRTCSSAGPDICVQDGFVKTDWNFAYVLHRKSSKTYRKGWHGVLVHPREPSGPPALKD